MAKNKSIKSIKFFKREIYNKNKYKQCRLVCEIFNTNQYIILIYSSLFSLMLILIVSRDVVAHCGTETIKTIKLHIE